jgi:formylmethanofuran dehydrogenase subunit E
MGEFGVEQAKRLKAREEGLKGAEDKNFNMALIEAGLAMMSGTSANAFENIGKGALVGTKAYTAGVERIQNRKEKLDEAVAALENAKRSDKRVSQERMDRLQANVDNAATANAEALYNYGSKALDMTREDAKFAVQTHLQQQQIAASNKKSFEERMVMALGKGDMAAGYKALKAMDAKPADLMGEYNDFLKANPMLATGDQAAAINAFMRSKMALSGLGAVPRASSTAAGPVRD